MLLLHQAGAVKVGQVCRYTITYTPSTDRILPTPSHLHIRIRNASAVALRAAYLHGPYTLHVAAYPSIFDPYEKLEDPERYGEPEFEPYLKAGGHWQTKLTVPDDIRQRGDAADNQDYDAPPKTVTWIVEISSQIMFSQTASVSYELLVARDARSLDIGFAAVAGKGHGEPGRVEDFVKGRNGTEEKRNGQPKGVYSKAIHLAVEDTATLWSQPELPQWTEHTPHDPGVPGNLEADDNADSKQYGTSKQVEADSRKQKKIHLVILTHGLHSNLGADMLYLKESIDKAAKKAREDARLRRRTNVKPSQGRTSSDDGSPTRTENLGKPDGRTIPTDEEEQAQGHEDVDDNDEQLVVRGFPGNAVRTERGIQYLGKRLAKYILTLTYPDQPYLPPSKSSARSFTYSFSPLSKSNQQSGNTTSHGHKSHKQPRRLPYTFTKISFIGHSLGGLTQTYAMAYIQKHSPDFFKHIKPDNFVALASPLLGLSNENPMYVKFALDFGLVGRTGRDLGLSWRAPTFAKSSWSTMFGGMGGNANQEQGESKTDPTSKPLLRILPTGPAHQVLKMFRNRTVYSNVVNDGIVPLRTSCLLFLDWRGLDKVDNAQRENGLIATMASFGWNELTGSNTVSHRPKSSKSGQGVTPGESEEDLRLSPSPSRSAVSVTRNESSASDYPTTPLEPEPQQFLAQHHVQTSSSGGKGGTTTYQEDSKSSTAGPKSATSAGNPFNEFWKFFKPAAPKSASSTTQKTRKVSKKTSERFHRGQTIMSNSSPGLVSGDSEQTDQSQESNPKEYLKRPSATRGDSLTNDPTRVPPPKTSVFEAAGDILNPPIPTREWLLDPASRQRTIFHDRIYHPEDIPPPSPKRPRIGRSFSSGSLRSNASAQSRESVVDTSGIRVEEKIARAYHKGLSWRKVLVRLEPDAHNNMIVRRMFANAYGWEVVKHLCDTHFSDSHSATTKDSEEVGGDRAKSIDQPVGEEGQEVEGQTEHDAPDPKAPTRTTSELREASDEVKALHMPQNALKKMSSSSKHNLRRFSKDNESTDSWNDEVFEGSDDNDTDDEAGGPFDLFQRFWNPSPREGRRHSDQHSHSPKQSKSLSRGAYGEDEGHGTSEAEIADFLTQSPTTDRQSTFSKERDRGHIQDRSQRSAIDADVGEPVHVAGEARSQESQTMQQMRNGAPVGTSELGLQKPIVEQVSSPQSPLEQPRTPGSLTEHVARLSVEGKQDET